MASVHEQDIRTIRLKDVPELDDMIASREEELGRKLTRREKKQVKKKHKLLYNRAKKNEPKKRSKFMSYLTKGRTNRSSAGTIGLLIFLIIMGFISIWPVLFIVGRAFMPLSELFRFPPLFWPENPTLDNFRDLWVYEIGRAHV